jgi:hypothetical protein
MVKQNLNIFSPRPLTESGGQWEKDVEMGGCGDTILGCEAASSLRTHASTQQGGIAGHVLLRAPLGYLAG